MRGPECHVCYRPLLLPSASVVLEWSKSQLLAAIRPVAVSVLSPTGHDRSVLVLLPIHSHPGHLETSLFSCNSPNFPSLLLKQGAAPSVRDVSTMMEKYFLNLLPFFSPLSFSCFYFIRHAY